MVKRIAFIDDVGYTLESYDKGHALNFDEFIDTHDIVNIEGSTTSKVVWVSYMDYGIKP